MIASQCYIMFSVLFDYKVIFNYVQKIFTFNECKEIILVNKFNNASVESTFGIHNFFEKK